MKIEFFFFIEHGRSSVINLVSKFWDVIHRSGYNCPLCAWARAGGRWTCIGWTDLTSYGWSRSKTILDSLLLVAQKELRTRDKSQCPRQCRRCRRRSGTNASANRCMVHIDTVDKLAASSFVKQKEEETTTTVCHILFFIWICFNLKLIFIGNLF